MEIARLILDYIDTLIWPASILVLVFRFKDQVIERLTRVTKMTMGTTSFEFADGILSLEREAEAISNENNARLRQENISGTVDSVAKQGETDNLPDSSSHTNKLSNAKAKDARWSFSSTELLHEAYSLTTISPRAALILGRLVIEKDTQNALISLHNKFGLEKHEGRRFQSAQQNIRQLAELMGASWAVAARNAVSLADRAAHELDLVISESETISFLNSVDLLTTTLEAQVDSVPEASEF